MTTAAKQIRPILKANFPGIKFSVTSDYDSVRVAWTNGPSNKQVESLVAHFEQGKFDGMTDSYDYNNVRTDIPQVKWLFCNREISEDIYQQAFNDAKGYYSFIEGLANIDTWIDIPGYQHARHFLWRKLYQVDLSQGYSFDQIKDLGF